MAWLVMIREPAQAGNRTSKTGHHLQWSENCSERLMGTSAAEKWHNNCLMLIRSFSLVADIIKR